MSFGFFVPLLYFEFVVAYFKADFDRHRVQWERKHAVFSQTNRNVDKIIAIVPLKESSFCFINHE